MMTECTISVLNGPPSTQVNFKSGSKSLPPTAFSTSWGLVKRDQTHGLLRRKIQRPT